MNYIPLFIIFLLNFPIALAMDQNNIWHQETIQTLAQRAWFESHTHSYQIPADHSPDRLALYGITPSDYSNIQQERTLIVPEQKPISCPLYARQLALHCTQQEFEQKNKDLSNFLAQLHDSNDLFSDALNLYLKCLAFQVPALPILLNELEREDAIMRSLRNDLQDAEYKLQGRVPTDSKTEFTINAINQHATNLQTSLKKLMALEFTIRLCQIHQNCDSARATIAKARMQPFENWALNKITSEKNKGYS